jgi:hypothetical protein
MIKIDYMFHLNWYLLRYTILTHELNINSQNTGSDLYSCYDKLFEISNIHLSDKWIKNICNICIDHE